MNIILQIPSPEMLEGVIESSKRKLYTYYLEEYQETSVSPSIFLKKYLSKFGEKVKLIWIFPVSLTTIIIKEDREKILEAINNIEEFLNGIKTEEIDEIYPIQSISIYNDIKFNGDSKEIEMFIFLKLVKEFLTFRKLNKEDNFNIYFDISTGQNIYISIILNAIRKFIVFSRLYHLDKGIKNEKTNSYIFFSEPIIPFSEKKKLRVIGPQKLDVKVFFDFPLDYKDWSDNFVYNYIKSGVDKNTLRSLRKAIEKGYILYNSVKKCCPLVAYYTIDYDLDSIERILEIFYEEITKKQKKVGYINSINEAREEKVIDTIIGFGFIIGLNVLLRFAGVAKKDYVNVKELDSFDSIFSSLELDTNTLFLKNELTSLIQKVECVKSNIREGLKYKLKDIEKLILDEIEKNNQKIIERKFSSEIRNFFAHAGLEKNITIIKIENGEIFLGYDEETIRDLEDFKGKIYNWLTKN